MINVSKLWLIVLGVVAISQVGCGRLDKLAKPQATTIGQTLIGDTPLSRKQNSRKQNSRKQNSRKQNSRKQNSRKSVTRHQQQDIQLALAEAAESSGDVEQAIRMYENTQTDRPDVVLRLANLYVKQGLNERATEKYRQAIRLGANTPDVYSDLGYNLYLQQQYEEAEQQLEAALRLRPNFPRANNNLGLLYARTGRTQEALECFGRAGLTESDARANLALALLAEKNTSGAVTELDMAKAVDRTGKSAERIENLARIVRAVNNPHGTAPVVSAKAEVRDKDAAEVSLASFRK